MKLVQNNLNLKAISLIFKSESLRYLQALWIFRLEKYSIGVTPVSVLKRAFDSSYGITTEIGNITKGNFFF